MVANGHHSHLIKVIKTIMQQRAVQNYENKTQISISDLNFIFFTGLELCVCVQYHWRETWFRTDLEQTIIDQILIKRTEMSLI